MQSISFDRWLDAVDNILQGMIGLALDDLPDCNYRDMYDDGFLPYEAAKYAFQEAQ